MASGQACHTECINDPKTNDIQILSARDAWTTKALPEYAKGALSGAESHVAPQLAEARVYIQVLNGVVTPKQSLRALSTTQQDAARMGLWSAAVPIRVRVPVRVQQTARMQSPKLLHAFDGASADANIRREVGGRRVGREAPPSQPPGVASRCRPPAGAPPAGAGGRPGRR